MWRSGPLVTEKKSKWHLGLAFDDGTVCTYEIEDLNGKPLELAQALFLYSSYEQHYWNYWMYDN